MDIFFVVVSVILAIVLATASGVGSYTVWMRRSHLLQPVTLNTGLLTFNGDVRWLLVWTIQFGLASICTILAVVDGVHWTRWRALLADNFFAILLLYTVTSLIIWRRSRSR